MNLQDIENKLIDYLDDALTAEQRQEVEQELAKSSALRQSLEELRMVVDGMKNPLEFQPSQNLQRNFDVFLEKEQHKLQSNDTSNIVRLQDRSPSNRLFMQIAAAAAILLLGIFVGKNINANDPTEEINDLRAEMLALLQDNSTSQRIKAVNISYEIPQDEEIVNTLIQAMNIDASTNVRLAAMEALYEFADEPKVRTALCETLNHQTNPMIQLSLIKMLVNLKEKQAVDYFEGLLKKSDTTQEVKDEAQMGIFKMM